VSQFIKTTTDEAKWVSQELHGAPDKLRIKGRKTKWKSFIMAIREVWSQEEVNSITNPLLRQQAQLNTYIKVLIRFGNPQTSLATTEEGWQGPLQIAKISRVMNDLKSMSVRLDLRGDGHLRALHEELVQSVERLIQKKLDDVFRSRAAAAQLATNIDLNKVTELPAISQI
jgi:hypothetical protein